MGNQKEFLNEKQYQKSKRKIRFIALLILLIGIAVGGGMIRKGFLNRSSVDVPAIKAQQNAEFHANGFSQKYYELDAQLDKANFSIALYMVGGFVLIVSCAISLATFVSTKQREILAYKAQQIRPIAQEGIEKISPSVGITAKEIAKGIKEGLKDEE